MAAGTVKLYGRKKGNEILLHSPMAEAKRRYIEKLKDETPVEITLTVPKKSASKKQRGMIFGLLMKEAVMKLEQAGIDTSYVFKLELETGIPIDEHLLKECLYKFCPIFDDDGKRIGLSDADTKQANKFFEDSRAFLSSQFGIVISDPDPLYKKKKAKK